MCESKENHIESTLEAIHSYKPTPTLRITKRIRDAEITVEVEGVDKVLPKYGDVVAFTKSVLNGDDE